MRDYINSALINYMPRCSSIPSYGRYRDAYFKASGMNPYTGVVFNYVPLPGAEDAIYSRISDISVSIKALDYLDMPECVIIMSGYGNNQTDIWFRNENSNN